METSPKLTFNRKQVRPNFLSHYCGEFTLPSGKMSGYYRFPITDEEVNELSQDLAPADKPKQFLTWSEWALFASLRRKYGITYLHPKTKQEIWLSHIDALYEPPKEVDIKEELENKLLFYCDSRLNEILHMALETAQNASSQRDTANSQKSEKNFRASLDNSDFDVLY